MGGQWRVTVLATTRSRITTSFLVIRGGWQVLSCFVLYPKDFPSLYILTGRRQFAGTPSKILRPPPVVGVNRVLRIQTKCVPRVAFSMPNLLLE